MARGTILSGGLEICHSMSIGMTVFTGDSQMFPGQFECKLVMSKMLSQAIDAVMTIDTGCSIGDDMLLHEDRVTLTMAVRADVDIEDRHIRSMAVGADERFILRLELMRGQHEAGQLVRISPPIQNCEQGLRSVMFLMTIAALRDRIDAIHSAVFGQHIPHLRPDIGMAYFAAFVHRGGIPRRAVTGFAIPHNICMRVNSAKELSLHGVKFAGAEHRTAAGIGIACDDQRCDQPGNETSSGQAAQTSGSHSLSSVFVSTSRMWRNTMPRRYARTRR